MLQELQQRHEIPHGVDVVCHEDAQIIQGSDGLVHRMGIQVFSQTLNSAQGAFG
jgi:hypothetical protein